MLANHLLKQRKIQKFKEAEDSRYIYQNELDGAYFQHAVTYRYFKDLFKRRVSNKVSRDKAVNIAKNPK